MYIGEIDYSIQLPIEYVNYSRHNPAIFYLGVPKDPEYSNFLQQRYFIYFQAPERFIRIFEGMTSLDFEDAISQIIDHEILHITILALMGSDDLGKYDDEYIVNKLVGLDSFPRFKLTFDVKDFWFPDAPEQKIPIIPTPLEE